MISIDTNDFGIAAIAAYRPPWRLSNDWFSNHSELGRKFERFTGIRERGISPFPEDEVGALAVRNLVSATGCRLDDCVGLVLTASSIVLPKVLKDMGYPQPFDTPLVAARKICRKLDINPPVVFGVNWGCSGYGLATTIARKWMAKDLQRNQFILVVTANCTSRILDFGDPKSGPLFGDFSTATLITRANHPSLPARFRLVNSFAHYRTIEGPYFHYEVRKNVLEPRCNGGNHRVAQKVCFTLGETLAGVGSPIGADAAEAMAQTASEGISQVEIRPDQVDFLVPHQAGKKIGEWFAMKLPKDLGKAAIVDGVVADNGNVSSSSIPYALLQNWEKLHGTIVCPMAGVGRGQKAEMSRGCIVLQEIVRQ